MIKKKIANWYFKLKQNHLVDGNRDHSDALTCTINRQLFRHWDTDGLKISYGLNCKADKDLQNKQESAANHANGTLNQLSEHIIPHY